MITISMAALFALLTNTRCENDLSAVFQENAQDIK